MKPTERVTPIEYQRRLDVLMGLRARGLSSSQLIQIACQQWGVSDRQAKRYIKKAKEQEAKLMAQPLEAKYSFVLQKVLLIYQQAIQLNDWDLALRATAELKSLLKQEQKELLNDKIQAAQPGILGFEELEKFLGAFEENQADPES